MVMEYLRGDDLRTLIKTNRTGDLHCKLAIALQIARALEHIHTQKIIHRDIKPENIQVTASGVVKLMDFGIAKAENTALTRPGFTLGTPYYMAPEQVRGMPATPQVDIYAFGVLLYELLVGKRPIEAESIEKVFYSILHGAVDVTPITASGAPQALTDLVASCTAKDPAQRPTSFSAVCLELERILRRLQRGPVDTTAHLQVLVQPSQGGAVATPTPTPGGLRIPTPTPTPTPARVTAAGEPARVNPWLIGAAIGGVVLLAVAAYLYFSGSRLAPVISTPTGDMVLVPGGSFLSGPDKKKVTLPAFYIDKTEVSNAAYAQFCKEKGRPLPELFLKDHPYYPVVNITYVDAQEFARWAGKRLPTLAEWEKAARGRDGQVFPWGSQQDPRRANVLDNPDRKTPDLESVDSFPQGASPYGALNMVGNVWEFIDDMRTPGEETLKAFSRLLSPPPNAFEPWYAIRGGAYDTKLTDSVLWDIGVVPARYRAFNIGFRCVKDTR
jgi:hypothetical protein